MAKIYKVVVENPFYQKEYREVYGGYASSLSSMFCTRDDPYNQKEFIPLDVIFDERGVIVPYFMRKEATILFFGMQVKFGEDLK